MGLLTSPSTQDKFPRMFMSVHKKLCWGSYVIGLVWFFLLAFKPLGLSVYFSENALLPGLVRGGFDTHNEAKRYLDALKVETKDFLNEVPVSYLLAAFKQLGLDSYVQEFVVHKPLSALNATGTNVYAILRAPRSIGTEALLLSTPYRAEFDFHPTTLPSIALMLSVAKYFKKHTYWSKDIIFLITDHEQIGMQAWLEAYHQTSISNGVIESGDLTGRSGSIQAAVNLEISSEKVNQFDVKIEGLNGQLPNLDLFNLAVYLCKKEGFQVMFKGRKDSVKRDVYQEWQYALKTMFAMIRSQATGIPTGNHGLLHRFHIEALTLEGRFSSKHKSSQGFFGIGMLVEGIFRSLNNLLERFHQSYFFYLLPGTSRFVSIGLYMPPFSLLAIGALIKALALRFEMTHSTEKQLENESEKKTTITDHVDYGLASGLPILIITHTFGLLVYISPEYLAQLSDQYHMKTEATVCAGIVSIFFATLVSPLFISMSSNGIVKSWIVLKCIALVELATLLFSMAFINFSLACIIALIYVPICVSVSPSKKRVAKWFKGLPVLLASPLVLTFLFVMYDTMATFPEVTPLKLLEKTYFATRHSLMYSIIDSYVYGNWLFAVGTTLLFPVWLQFWIITNLKI